MANLKEICCEFINTEVEKQQKTTKDFSYCDELLKLANCAKNLNFVSHVAKFNNPSAKVGVNVFLNRKYMEEIKKTHYLGTGSLPVHSIDCFGNAKDLPGAKFLTLEDDLGVSLYDYLFEGNKSILSEVINHFNIDKELAEDILEKFLAAVAKVKINNDLAKCKQLYFPKSNNINDGNYFILVPVYSSTLQHSLSCLVKFRSSDDYKDIKNSYIAKKENKSNSIYREICKIGRLSFGGTQAQNVSWLNSKRNGISYLVSNEPPEYVNFGLLAATEEKINKLFIAENKGELNSLVKNYDYLSKNITDKYKVKKENLDSYVNSYCELSKGYIYFYDEIKSQIKDISQLPSCCQDYLTLNSRTKKVDLSDFVSYVAYTVTKIISDFYKSKNIFLDDELRNLMRKNMKFEIQNCLSGGQYA